MPQIINTNIPSLTAQRNLNQSQSSQATALQRLSSGLRINSARDDAAGLAISTRFDTQVRGLNVAIRNAGDGVSLAQVTESSLGAMTNNLQRIRELALQSANGTNNVLDRQAINQEVQQLKLEIQRISEQANFNGTKLLDGTFSNITFQIGANSGEAVEVSIEGATVDELGASISSGVSARGTKNTLEGGDLIINGVSIPAASTNSDTASVALKSASAIAKVAAINSKTEESGVSAEVLTNSAEGSQQTLPATATNGQIYINGQVIDISVSPVFSAEANREATVSAINAYSDQTGVVAINTGNDNTGIVLEADDGRNITLLYDGTITPGVTGLPDSDLDGDVTTSAAVVDITNPTGAELESGTIAGGYTLISRDGQAIEIQQGTTGDLNQNAGLAEGTYAANGAFLNSLSQSGNVLLGQQPNPLLDGEIIINGVPVPAANSLNDTASNTDKTASAIAITAAINSVSEQTGVSAKSNRNLVNGADMTGGSGSLTGAIIINGVSTSSITVSSADTELSRLNVVTAINAVTGQTGVTAIDTGSDEAGVQLVAGDGRNISWSFDDTNLINLTNTAGIDFSGANDVTINVNNVTGGVGPLAVPLNTDYTATGAGGLDQMVADINSTLIGLNPLIGITASVIDGQLAFAADNGTDTFAITDGGGTVSIDTAFGAGILGLGGVAGNFTGGTSLENYESLSGLSGQGNVAVASIRLNASEEFSLSSSQPSGLSNHGLTFGTFGSGTDGQFIKDIDVSTAEGALAALAAVDNALQTINIQRATLGAVQNRFESTITNQAIAMENLAAANSRIRDADFAAETAALSRAQVLQQAGISILGQANALPQQVLNLLQ